MDNQALNDVLKNKSNKKKFDFTDYNKLLAHVASDITSGLRFCGNKKIDLRDIQTSLVPINKLHFSMVSYAPLRNGNNCKLSSSEITDMCFKPESQFTTLNARYGKYLSVCSLYRGKIDSDRVMDYLICLKESNLLKFFNSTKNNTIQVGQVNKKPVHMSGECFERVSRSACTLSNNSAIKFLWSGLNKKFYRLYKKKAFLHYYLNDGMTECEFESAHEEIIGIENSYEQLN